jgi:hypothetical protein
MGAPTTLPFIQEPSARVNPWCVTGLVVDCTGALYALTAARSDSYTLTRSLVRVSITNGFSTLVCSFATLESAVCTSCR